MTFRNGILLLVAALLVSCGKGPASYEVAREAREGSLLMLDWSGEGRELASGQVIAISHDDPRRKTFVSINLRSGSPLLWRSTLDHDLKFGGVSPDWVRTEPIERAKLARAYLPNDKNRGDFFFKEGVGADLNSDMYVAHCSPSFTWENGVIHCSTALVAESFVLEIRFDKAFLWDFDNLQARAVAAAKDYIARPSTQQLIKSIPGLNSR